MKTKGVYFKDDCLIKLWCHPNETELVKRILKENNIEVK